MKIPKTPNTSDKGSDVGMSSAILTVDGKLVKPIIPPKAQAALRIIETLGPLLAAEIGVARSEPSGQQLTYATAILTIRNYLESSGPDFSPNLNHIREGK